MKNSTYQVQLFFSNSEFFFKFGILITMINDDLFKSHSKSL